MAARSGMSDLLAQLRGMTHTAEGDYTIGVTDFWTDDQLQQVMDRHRVNLDQYPLTPIPRSVGGGQVQWFEYRCGGYENFERTTGGTAIFIVEDATGVDAGTAAYTPDYNLGIVTFASDTKGIEYRLTGRSYDLNGAAAEIWRQKSGHFAAAVDSFDFSTDNMSVRRSQRIDQAMTMWKFYAREARPKTALMYRSDTQ